MALPLFGFSGQQIQARPVLRNRAPQGFFDQLGAAFNENFATSTKQANDLELQRSRQDFARNEATKSRQFAAHDAQVGRRQDIDDQVAAGTRVPDTAENRQFLERVLPEDALGNAFIELSDGERVINPVLWARAQQLNDQTIETIPVDTESLDSIASVLGRFGIEVDASAIVDPDGNSRTSEARMAQLMTILDLASTVTGHVQRDTASIRTSLARTAGSGDSTKAREDFTKAVNQKVADGMLSTQVIHRETGEEVVGVGKRVLLQKLYESGLSPFEEASPLIAELETQFHFLPMPTSTAALETADKIVRDAMSSTTKAQAFLDSTAQPVINRLGADVVRERLGANSNTHSDVVFASKIQSSAEFVKAMMLLSRFENANELEEYFLDLGGYQGFRAFYHGSVIRLVQDLDPENFGSLDVRAVTRGSGRRPEVESALDAPGGDSEIRTDSSFVVPNPSGASVLQQEGRSIAESNVDLGNTMAEAFTLSLDRDPQAAKQIDDLILAVMDPTIGEAILLQEFEDARRLANTPGVYTPEQAAAMNAWIDSAIELVKENSGNLAEELGPILSDALINAEESLAR